MNWRTQAKRQNAFTLNNFESKMKMPFTNSPKKNLFKKNKNYDNRNNKDSPLFNKRNKKSGDIQIQELGGKFVKEEPPVKSFNKKIVIQTKNNHKSYKDSFQSLQSNVTITKFTKNKQKNDESLTSQIVNDSWGSDTDEEEKIEKMKRKKEYMKLDPEQRYKFEKMMSDYHIGCLGLQKKPMSKESYHSLEKLNILFKLQMYLLMDFSAIEFGYNYMKELNINPDTFIYKYSLDKLIEMEPKDFLKYDRNIQKKYRDILKLQNKKPNQLNKQQKIKLQKKNEIFFKKYQNNFYKKYFNHS